MPTFTNDTTTGIPLLDTTPTGAAGAAIETRAILTNNHLKDTAAHGATVAATANRIVLRGTGGEINATVGTFVTDVLNVATFRSTFATGARFTVDSVSGAANAGFNLSGNGVLKWVLATYNNGRFTFYNGSLGQEAIGIDSATNAATFGGDIVVGTSNIVRARDATGAVSVRGADIYQSGAYFNLYGSSHPTAGSRGRVEIFSDRQDATAGAGEVLFGSHSAGGSFLVNVTIDRAGNLNAANTVTAAKFAGVGVCPTGSVVAYAFSYPPEGWLLCDGSAVSRTTYAGLFTLIGTTFGSGDGSTSFNVPNMGGQYVAGANNGAYEVGDQFGDDVPTGSAVGVASPPEDVVAYTSFDSFRPPSVAFMYIIKT